MKILSFPHLKVVPNLCAEHKYDILKNMCNQTGHIDFHSMEGLITCLVNDILQNIFFCVWQKKEILTDLKQFEGE